MIIRVRKARVSIFVILIGLGSPHSRIMDSILWPNTIAGRKDLSHRPPYHFFMSKKIVQKPNAFIFFTSHWMYSTWIWIRHAISNFWFRFGMSKMKDTEIVETLVRLLAGFDILLLQEVVDMTGQAVNLLLQEVNQQPGEEGRLRNKHINIDK